MIASETSQPITRSCARAIEDRRSAVARESSFITVRHRVDKEEKVGTRQTSVGKTSHLCPHICTLSERWVSADYIPVLRAHPVLRSVRRVLRFARSMLNK